MLPASSPERLTDRLVRALPMPLSGNKITFDGEVAGFGARVTAAGARAFVLEYRCAGRNRRITIGSFPDWSTAAAREEAKALKRRIDRGEDPMGERHEMRAEPTIDDLCDRYLSEHVTVHNKASTAAEVRRLVETRIRPALGKVKLSDLNRAKVKAWHTASSARPWSANRALAALSKLMSLAAHEWELCAENPCKGVKRFPEQKRERYFSDGELQRIGQVLAKLEREQAALPGCIAAIRLLALTGMRLGEVLGLRWDWIDMKRATLALPDAKAGALTVALSAPVVELLASLERTGDHVVYGADPDKPLSSSTLEHVWDRVRRAAKLPDGRLHDLRHSVGTYAAHAGGNAFIIRDLLGHKTMAMTGRYVQRAVDPVRLLADKVSGRIAAALNGDSGEVVPLRGNKR